MSFGLNFIKYFANLKISIVLLLLIISSGILGSIIDQNEYTEFSFRIIEPSFFLAKFIKLFGLNHIFNTVWFICLLLLFGLSLGCCTFFQQLPMLKNIRRIKLHLTKKNAEILPLNLILKSIPIGKYVCVLQKSDYKIFQSRGSVYAIKGLIGRISPIVVHFSMICLLFSSFFAFLSQFVAQETIPETEIFHIQNLLGNNLNILIPQITARVNDFWVSYKVDLTEKQFYTDISLIDNNGKEIKRETIYVNHPLKYLGFTLYQTDWNNLSTRIDTTNNNIYQFPVLNKTKRIWFSEFEDNFSKIQKNLPSNKYFILTITNWGINYLYDKLGSCIRIFEFNESILTDLVFLGFVKATGLQIKADPGICLIYISFMLLITSIVVSYISCLQIWSDFFVGKLEIKGTSNRSKIELESEVLYMILKF